jgi:hypothetical protein
MSNSYIVSLQVWHPDADPEYIVAGLDLPPRRYWKVGDQRTTPNGDLLDGENPTTYCIFDLGDGEDKELSSFLEEILVKLEIHAAFIWQLRRTGGKVSFFVLWTPGDHRGESFDVDLLSSMARIGIDLGIEPMF